MLLGQDKTKELNGISMNIIREHMEEIKIARTKGEWINCKYDLTWALATAFMFGYRNGIKDERKYRRTGIKEWDLN